MVVTDGVGRWRMLGVDPKGLQCVALPGTKGKPKGAVGALLPDLYDEMTRLCLRDLVRDMLDAPDMCPEVQPDDVGVCAVRVVGWPPFYGGSVVEVLVVAGEHGRMKFQP
jgi:hypothetical protein